jgi:ADP-ribose pyrophosphatase YjhB (NUDIX family)
VLTEVRELLQWARAPLLWLSGRANRKRLGGARVEIIGMVMCARTTPSVLIARSVYDDCWMPPQEGVNIGESFFGALARGLSEECDVSIMHRDGQLKSDFYLRDIEYVDTLWLPPERWGERAVAGNVGDTLFSHVVLRKKAYWAAYLVVDDMRVVRGRANLREVADVAWMTVDEAYTKIQGNRDEKALLLVRCLQKGMQHLVGARAANERFPPGDL